MRVKLLSCISLPPATITSIPIYDYAIANEELAKKGMEQYNPCCGKKVCGGCIYSFRKSGNGKCPFCNPDRCNKTDEEMVEELMKRVEVNDAGAICMLANFYHHGRGGLQQDQTKAIELFTKSADLGHSDANFHLADFFYVGGNLKKAKFYKEAAAMAGHEMARCKLGLMEFNSGNMDRAVKHWTIAASAGEFDAMHHLRTGFEKGAVSRDSIDSTLKAYNSCCAEMRSEARDAYIQNMKENII
jgi:TPR repeat protein